MRKRILMAALAVACGGLSYNAAAGEDSSTSVGGKA